MSAPQTEGVRINRFLASCGQGSRRGCEKLVENGEVTINGQEATLGSRVIPGDSVKVNGRRVRPPEELTILFYKPRGYICTKKDSHDRKTIYDILPGRYHRLNYVGRLDKESEGLLLLTSSGDLSQALTHPRHSVEKEYHVLIDRPLAKEDAEKFVEGVHTSEGLARAERVEELGKRWVSLVLKQGLKRQIRLMFAKSDYKVKRLVRIRIGELIAPDLEPGAFAELDHDGLEMVQRNPKKS